jgi:hypothetical protein
VTAHAVPLARLPARPDMWRTFAVLTWKRWTRPAVRTHRLVLLDSTKGTYGTDESGAVTGVS